MDAEKYLNKSQQRILYVLLSLFGREDVGLSPNDISKITGVTPSGITRDLANLQIAGMAEPDPATGRWRLTPRIISKSLAALRAVERGAQKFDELKQRYTRG